MRISERQRYRVTNNRVGRARQSNVDMLEKISTLKRINKLSDDPSGAAKSIRYRDRIDNLDQFKSNIEFSKGYLDKTETAIQTMADNLMRAQELAISLSNATYDASSRDAGSKELKQIMNEIVNQANTTYAGRFIFSGFRTNTPSMGSEGRYLGDDGAMFLQVDDGDFRQINMQARYLFEATEGERDQGHFNMVDALDILHSGLTDNNIDNIRIGMKELNHQIQKTTSYQATLGSLYHALESGENKVSNETIQAKEILSKVEEVDMFKASSDFHRSESILQSTLLASNKMLQPSLLNFMQ